MRKQSFQYHSLEDDMSIYVINFPHFHPGARNQRVESLLWFILLQKRAVINALNRYLTDFIYNYLLEYPLTLSIRISSTVTYSDNLCRY